MLVHRKAESSGADERESNSIVDIFSDRLSTCTPPEWSSPLQLLRVVFVLRVHTVDSVLISCTIEINSYNNDLATLHF